ncbi:unnamed protein product [Meganyctiphanes norvegica]|uniref:Sulfotransferase n=1 Tax=Meganyctiphanes norvegica TaxID=48144 RepID=A0AAV2QGN6_MEGNR
MNMESSSSSPSTMRLLWTPHMPKWCYLVIQIMLLSVFVFMVTQGTGSYVTRNESIIQATQPIEIKTASVSSEETPPESPLVVVEKNSPESLSVVVEKNPPDSPLVVILFSSTQRSGSSMMGELLSTMDNSQYWFEPFKKINHTDCYENRKCSGEYLSLTYKCILESKYAYKKCLSTSSRVIKLVRGSLADMSVALTDPEFNVKLIHLTRDPRGSLNSIPRSWGSGGDNPSVRCKEIDEDMETYSQIEPMYPGKVMNMSYERFCIDALGKTIEMYNFLYGKTDIPDKTKKYLETHMTGASNGYFNTVRDTTSHIHEWRKQIKESFFYKIEKESYCQAIINKMGYKILGSIDSVRNISVSVFL